MFEINKGYKDTAAIFTGQGLNRPKGNLPFS